ALTAGMDEFYGRALPGPVHEMLFVQAAQLYGRHALRLDDSGLEFFPQEPSWSENDLVQAIARLPGGRAWYVLDEKALALRVRGSPGSGDGASLATVNWPPASSTSEPTGGASPSRSRSSYPFGVQTKST